jgi:hypothetical protein
MGVWPACWEGGVKTEEPEEREEGGDGGVGVVWREEGGEERTGGLKYSETSSSFSESKDPGTISGDSEISWSFCEMKRPECFWTGKLRLCSFGVWGARNLFGE